MHDKNKDDDNFIRIPMSTSTIIGVIILPIIILLMLYVILFSECSYLLKNGQNSKFEKDGDKDPGYKPSDTPDDEAVRIDIDNALGLTGMDETASVNKIKDSKNFTEYGDDPVETALDDVSPDYKDNDYEDDEDTSKEIGFRYSDSPITFFISFMRILKPSSENLTGDGKNDGEKENQDLKLADENMPQDKQSDYDESYNKVLYFWKTFLTLLYLGNYSGGVPREPPNEEPEAGSSNTNVTDEQNDGPYANNQGLSDDRYKDENQNVSSDESTDASIANLYATSPFVSHDLGEASEKQPKDGKNSTVDEQQKPAPEAEAAKENLQPILGNVRSETPVADDGEETGSLADSQRHATKSDITKTTTGSEPKKSDGKDITPSHVITPKDSSLKLIADDSGSASVIKPKEHPSLSPTDDLATRKIPPPTLDEGSRPSSDQEAQEGTTIVASDLTGPPSGTGEHDALLNAIEGSSDTIGVEKSSPIKHPERHTEELRSMYYRYKDFSIPNTFICPEKGEGLNLLIGIHSKVREFERRKAIRETWARAVKLIEGAQYVFVVGIGLSSDMDQKLKQESDKYRDIIQTDILDKKANSEANPVLFLKWVQRFCPKVKYFSKTEDNIFLNVPQIYQYIIDNEIEENSMHGYLYEDQIPFRNLENENEYVPRDLYGPDFYPKYLGKEAYLIPGKYAKILYDEAEKFPYFPKENILITGILPENLKNQNFTMPRIDSKDYFLNYRQMNTSKVCSILPYCVIYPLEANDMINLWKVLRKNVFYCFNFMESMKYIVESQGQAMKANEKLIYAELIGDKSAPLY